MDPDEYENIARLEERHWWYRGMATLSRCVVTSLPLPPDARILDAGCGTGGNLAWLADAGAATGMDISPPAIRLAAQKTGAPLAIGSATGLPFPDGCFHLVTSFEVLYHAGVADDLAALREFWRVLPPGGWLALRLPAHNWLRGAHDVRVHTARRYARPELRRKLLAAGFEVVHLTPVGLWLLPGAILSRGWQALRGSHRRPASDLHLPPAPLNRLLGAALALEARVAARWRLPWGLSLLAVARKARGETTEITRTNRLAGGITAFFPAYNDGGTIASMIITALTTLPKLTDDYEVVVVNDGSSDYTAEVLAELTRQYPQLRVIQHPENRGYGGALRTGFASASKAWIFYTDGDAQYDPCEMTRLAEGLGDGVDVVNGYKITRHDPLHRIIIGRLYHHIVRMTFGFKLRDVDCDFRLIRRAVFDRFELESTTGAICVEMVKKMQDTGVVFAEVPVHHYHRAYGKSQLFNFRRLWRTGLHLLALWWKLVVRREHLRGQRK